MKTLILRTDRLGDFYITIPYINSLTRLYGKKNVDVIVKKHIYYHIKKKKFLYNKLYSFAEKGIFERISLIFKLRKQKYKQLIIFDGKDRSIILSKFLNVEKIYHTYPRKKKNYLANILFSKKYITFFDDRIIPLADLYKKIFDRIGINIIRKDFNILLYKNIKKIGIFKNENIGAKKFVHIHVDEKWFSNFYIKELTNISPNVDDFFFFLRKIVKVKKTNLIITTGTIELPFIKKIACKYFFAKDKKYFYLKVGKFKVILLNKVSIVNLEIISMNASNIITCHSPLTHIAASFNINLIDIIDKAHERWYYRHTSHIKKYNKLYRETFNKLSKKILLKIK